MNIFKKSLLLILIIVFLFSSLLSFNIIENKCMAQTQYATYKVVKGDTLWIISKEFNTTVLNLKTINNLSSNIIYIGQILKVPFSSTPGLKNIKYLVKSGDTLSKIAEYFGSSIPHIKSINGFTSDLIYVNQLLIIPASYINYTVKYGDTLYKIGTNYKTTAYRIKLFSGLNSYTIYPNQILNIPYLPVPYSISYITYTVVKGDTIWGLSVKYGIPQNELLDVNNLNKDEYLSIGQQIKIPVHSIPVTATPGPEYGEYLDWWTQSQYLFPINKIGTVRDLVTGTTFKIKRSIGANHADCEPLTSEDTANIKNIWGEFSWVTRAVVVEVDGRKIAASMSFMPHGVQYNNDNNFDGHFDLHFKNSTRHIDGQLDPYHQEKVKKAAGIIK